MQAYAFERTAVDICHSEHALDLLAGPAEPGSRYREATRKGSLMRRTRRALAVSR
jgi:hypothetical protein